MLFWPIEINLSAIIFFGASSIQLSSRCFSSHSHIHPDKFGTLTSVESLFYFLIFCYGKCSSFIIYLFL